MSKIGLIISREYSTRVKKRSFLLMTILGPILIVGFYAAAIYLGTKDAGKLNVHIFAENQQITEFDFKDTDDYEFLTVQNIDQSEFEAYVRDNDFVDVGLNIPHNITYSNVAKILTKKPISSSKEAGLQRMTERYVEKLLQEENDIPDSVFNLLNRKLTFHTIDVNTNKESLAEQKSMIGFGFAIVIYLFIFLYGVQVMRGVIEEKTSRIVEVMVSSIKPFQLMMGKIIGIALVGLTQFAVWVILSTTLLTLVQGVLLKDTLDPQNLVSAQAEQLTAVGMELPIQGDMIDADNPFIRVISETQWGLIIGMFLFFFLFGYLLYAALFAAVGAAVDSEADTQQFMLPITVPLIFSFIISTFALSNPDSEALVWFSYVPFTSPICMLVRIAQGVGEAVMWWEIFLSMFLLIVTFLGTTWLAGKIYRTGILMYGKKVTYRELFKWLKY